MQRDNIFRDNRPIPFFTIIVDYQISFIQQTHLSLFGMINLASVIPRLIIALDQFLFYCSIILQKTKYHCMISIFNNLLTSSESRVNKKGQNTAL